MGSPKTDDIVLAKKLTGEVIKDVIVGPGRYKIVLWLLMFRPSLVFWFSPARLAGLTKGTVELIHGAKTLFVKPTLGVGVGVVGLAARAELPGISNCIEKTSKMTHKTVRFK